MDVRSRLGRRAEDWTWDEFRALPSETVTVDIHCVTRWSKLDTMWQGVSVDTLLSEVEHDSPYVFAFSDGVHDEPAIRGRHRRESLGRLRLRRRAARARARRPGAAARTAPLLLEEREVGPRAALRDEDEPGFWETYGYHTYGDPWLEQRFAGD